MKLSTALAMLSLLAGGNATELRGNRELGKNNKNKEWVFDCGPYGEGSMEIEKGKLSFHASLENLDSITSANAFTYHLHTLWKSSSDYSTSCGPTTTGGHYDPTLRCSAASDAQGLPQCDGKGYDCDDSDSNSCEVGDLSGKFGSKLQIDGMGEGSISESGGKAPNPNPGSFVEDNDERHHGLFSSVVFHDAATGSRELCCKLVAA